VLHARGSAVCSPCASYHSYPSYLSCHVYRVFPSCPSSASMKRMRLFDQKAYNAEYTHLVMLVELVVLVVLTHNNSPDSHFDLEARLPKPRVLGWVQWGSHGLVSLYIYRTRAAAGIGSACGPGASPTPDLRESTRDVPRTRKYRLCLALTPERTQGGGLGLLWHRGRSSVHPAAGAPPGPRFRSGLAALLETTEQKSRTSPHPLPNDDDDDHHLPLRAYIVVRWSDWASSFRSRAVGPSPLATMPLGAASYSSMRQKSRSVCCARSSGSTSSSCRKTKGWLDYSSA
jgi:hypothetical protein